MRRFIKKPFNKRSRDSGPPSFIPAFMIGLFAVAMLLGSWTSCQLYRLEQKLGPEDAEFLSKVRYIITREERKIFLELPESEREKFVEDFWKRRDPDPTTVDNEFKREYFNRMERASELFMGEGKPGWLTDRGRIYVLFGPPTDRITNPMGGDPYSRCSEIWYYGNFPVVFIDSTCTGTFVLTTLNLAHLHDLNLAQAYFQKTFQKEKAFFDFNWSLRKTRVEEERFEGLIILEIPYAGIWFKAEDERLMTDLQLELRLEDFENKTVWEFKSTFEVSILESELRDMKDKRHRLEIPVVIEKDLDRLRLGKNLLHALLKNLTGAEESRKVMEFSL